MASPAEDGIRMPDYMYQLESRLSAEQWAGLVRIQELAAASEMNLYLVGGAVRDLISGMPIRDLDFTIEGNPSRIVRELEKGGAQITGENEAFRSVELILAGEVEASISAAREDFYAHPGSKMEVRFSTIMEDLRRRDFSINAIAISLNANSRGLLLDPTNGLADLERREIRAPRIPEQNCKQRQRQHTKSDVNERQSRRRKAEKPAHSSSILNRQYDWSTESHIAKPTCPPEGLRQPFTRLAAKRTK